jgi:CheY-like chemotaxis protein
VDEAASAAEADALLARERYEVVLLDFVLPDRDGVDCLRAWRASGLATPILCLTGAESDTILEALVLAGAHDVLSKEGITEAKLAEAIEATGGPPGYPEEDLPRDPAAPPAAAPEPRPAIHGAGRLALVVDDTATIRLLVRRILERDGWRVEERASATDALDRAPPDVSLLVLDYLLPDIDGVALLEELRRQGVAAPAIALTGHGSEQVAVDFIATGANAFLAKRDLDGPRLRAAVAEALES